MAQAVQTNRPVAGPSRRGLPLNLHEGWIAALLLTLLLVSVTASVASANWVDGLWQTMYAAIGGMFFGALVARLRLNSFLAFVLALIVGAGFVSWLVSGQVGAPLDATWNEKMLLIQTHLDEWLVRVLGNDISSDNFVFLCVMCALAWLIGYVSAWSIFRHHQPWGAILPAGAALLLNVFYAPPQSGVYLVLFLLATLLLLVRTTLLKRQQAWSAYAVRFANDIGLDFLTYGLVFSGLIILIAWLIPPTAPGPAWLGFVYDQVREPWQDLQDDFTRAFSNVRGTDSAAPTTYFGSSLSMGGPIRLGDREVFQIQSPYGRYWRAVVFDQYTGVGWASEANESASFLIGDPRLVPMPMEKRRTITQTVEVRLPTDNLVVNASQPQRLVNEAVDARFSVGRALNGDGYIDIHSLRLQRPLKLGDKYSVVSSISAADLKSLQTASTAIPPYIRETYLGLPDSVTARTRELALDITSGATNTYDKARAIEQYLRQHITYNDNVEPVPGGVDGVDYVLFERPEGYCNYYASAMAVMARSVGIPARVASGYAVGSASDDGFYHVSEANAHSWPELYLGELGWVEFEPTAAQPEISRPVAQDEQDRADELRQLNEEEDIARRGFGEQRAEDLLNNSPSNERPGLANDFWTRPQMMLTYAFVLAGLVAVGVLTFLQLRWQKYLKTLKPGAQAVAEMYRYAPLAGMPERAEATADERAQDLVTLMPDARQPISDVNALYVRERYGEYDLTAEESGHARAQAIAVQERMWHTVYDRFLGRHIRGAWTSLQGLTKSGRKTKPKE